MCAKKEKKCSTRLILFFSYWDFAFCLLIYGLFVIGFYVRHAKKRKTHLRSYCFLVGFSLVVWAYYYSRPTETRIGEEANPARSGSVVILWPPGFRGSDGYLYVRDYATSGQKLISLDFHYPIGTDYDWTPVLSWSKNGSSLNIQKIGKPEILTYNFKTHKIVHSSTSVILREPQEYQESDSMLDNLYQRGRYMRNWEGVVWGLGFS